MKISTKGEYYGSMRLEQNFGGVVISEYDYTMPSTDWHYHENPYFMYVLQGNVGDINNKLKRNCTSGSLIFHNWQEPHFNTKESKLARGFISNLNENGSQIKKLMLTSGKAHRSSKIPKFIIY